MSTSEKDIVIGVLALQGAFQEHQECLEKGTGCKTIQVSSNYM
jgi:glutamine amidotransferase PdxT